MKYLTIIILSLFNIATFAQTECSDVKNAKILTNSYQCFWEFFEIQDTINATVVAHESAYMPCAFKASASVTILKVDEDTIRVLDVCNLDNFKVGAAVKVSAISAPTYKVSIPTYFYKDVLTNNYIYRCNEYDVTVERTTWGHIIQPPQKPKRKKNTKTNPDVVKSYK
jgi:hypothetical protein